MPTYTAYYKSLDSADEHISGLFTFSSTARLNTKTNAHDARMRMLEEFGNQALSWTIYRIERTPKAPTEIDGQQQLDFRKPTRHRRKDTKRGMI